jgi:hypothetical protein
LLAGDAWPSHAGCRGGTHAPRPPAGVVGHATFCRIVLVACSRARQVKSMLKRGVPTACATPSKLLHSLALALVAEAGSPRDTFACLPL